jgi:hypothetical protein
VVIAPPASRVTTEASWAIAAGAADSALATGSALPVEEVVFVSADAVLLPYVVPALLQPPTVITAPASSAICKLFDVIGPLLR